MNDTPYNLPKWLVRGSFVLLVLAFAVYVYLSTRPITIQFLESGVPVSGASVEIYNRETDNYDEELLTDERGCVEFPARLRGELVPFLWSHSFSEPHLLTVQANKPVVFDFYPDRLVTTEHTLWGKIIWTQRINDPQNEPNGNPAKQLEDDPFDFSEVPSSE